MFPPFVILIYTVLGISTDCANVINFAAGLNMAVKRPILFNSVKTDCCLASGVTCNGQTRVVNIDWSNQGLDGILNVTALPSTLLTLFLNYNQITGGLASLPPGLTHLEISEGNLLTGDLPFFPSTLSLIDLGKNNLNCVLPNSWPPGLLELYLDGNRCTGDVTPIPSPVRMLFLGLNAGYTNINQFSGSLTLDRPLNVGIYRNLITNVVITDPSQLIYCDLSNNPLLGNVNVIALVMCTRTGLYAASLLPDTRRTTLKSTVATTSTNIKVETTTAKTTSTTAKTTTAKTAELTVANKIATTLDQSYPKAALSTSIIATTSQSTTLTFSMYDKVSFVISSIQVIESTEAVEDLSYVYNTFSVLNNKSYSDTLTTGAQIFVSLKINNPWEFSLTVLVIFRFLTNCFIIGFVLTKTPFAREFKTKFVKRTKD